MITLYSFHYNASTKVTERKKTNKSDIFVKLNEFFERKGILRQLVNMKTRTTCTFFPLRCLQRLFALQRKKLTP